MIELQRQIKVVALATSVNVADHSDFMTNPIAALNALVSTENSALVVVSEDNRELRLYCKGERVSEFEAVEWAPYVVTCRLNGDLVEIGNASGEPVIIGNTEYRTPPVTFIGGYVADVTITKSTEGTVLSDLRF
jgi:hypothetical protein